MAVGPAAATVPAADAAWAAAHVIDKRHEAHLDVSIVLDQLGAVSAGSTNRHRNQAGRRGIDGLALATDANAALS